MQEQTVDLPASKTTERGILPGLRGNLFPRLSISCGKHPRWKNKHVLGDLGGRLRGEDVRSVSGLLYLVISYRPTVRSVLKSRSAVKDEHAASP
jgi:hypothetical protein